MQLEDQISKIFLNEILGLDNKFILFAVARLKKKNIAIFISGFLNFYFKNYQKTNYNVNKNFKEDILEKY